MSKSSEARAGFLRILPVLFAVIPFGLVYGAVAVERGLTVGQALGFSVFVYAGASQLVAIELLGLGSPIWAIVLSVFALNFRHVLYSASLGRKLTRFSAGQKAVAFFLLCDPVFAEAETRAMERPVTKTFYFVFGLVLYAGWQASTLLGAVFGSMIQNREAFAIDFILPVYFLTMLMSFRSRGGFVPVALLSGAAAILLYVTVGSPWHVTLGGLAGILYAAAFPPGRTDAPADARISDTPKEVMP